MKFHVQRLLQLNTNQDGGRLWNGLSQNEFEDKAAYVSNSWVVPYLNEDFNEQGNFLAWSGRDACHVAQPMQSV